MANLYLLYGEEKYDLEQMVEKLKKKMDRLEEGINFFYLTMDTIDQLTDVLQGVTFFGTEKLIIIKETKLKFEVTLLESLEEDTLVIVIEDSVDKRTSEYKKMAKIAECMEFKHMDQKQMIDYIMQILKKYQVKISFEDATYLQSICGEEKSNVINELQKLVIYLEEEKVVTRQIIDDVCSKTLNAKIFDVLSLIVNKQKQKAILQLNELLEQKEPIVKIYIMLYKQVKQMYMIRYLKQKGEQNIAQIMGIHPFVFKNLSKSSESYTLDKLKSIIYAFDVYDEKTKLGEMDFVIGLKKIICDM